MIEYLVRVNGNTKRIKIIDDNLVEIDKVRMSYKLIDLNSSQYILKINNKFYDASLWKISETEDSIEINNFTADISIRTTLQEKAYQLLSASKNNEEHITIIKSPMPGLVLKILKKIGDNIVKGETVMILEAMKMENEIKSNHDGTLSEINVIEGQPVEKYISLFSLK